jgi:beta-N-acetylhexosaminidase
MRKAPITGPFAFLCLLVCALVPASAAAPSPTLAQLVGQKLVVSMAGKTPSASLLARARRGEIGGVIVHSWNFHSSAQLRAIAGALQQAAAAGRQPRLLIAVDQEGGSVKTVRWLPPARAPGHVRSSADARADGRATGVALLGVGVNTDLAPVADVPGSRASEVYRQGRTWSFDSHTTARLATAFAAGLADGHALATMKHFPGLGFATADTDRTVVRITASRSRLAPGLDPYRSAIAAQVPVIMLSNAVYDAYDRTNAAGWSRPIATNLLRNELDFQGVTMTDSLDGAAHTRKITTNTLALAATKAGTDVLLLTGGEEATRSDYTSLLRAAQAGRLGRAGLERSYARILALKSRLVTH